MPFRVVSVADSGAVTVRKYSDALRARGEYRHLKRDPAIIFAGFFARYVNEGNYHPLILFRRPLPETILVERTDEP